MLRRQRRSLLGRGAHLRPEPRGVRAPGRGVAPGVRGARDPGRRRAPALRPEVLVEAATRPDVDIVVNAVVGAAGLDATLAALRAGKRVALANKESLVMAGDLVVQAACAGGGEIVPVDSEHSAVLQCVAGTGRRAGPADPHLLGRALSRVAGGADPAGDGGGGASPSHLADGAEDHGGQRHPGEQGARGDRGALPVPAVVRRAGGRSPSPEHHPRLRGVLRRQRDRAAGLPVHGAADSVRPDPSGPTARIPASAGWIRSRPARSPSSRCGGTSSARSTPGWRPDGRPAPRRPCSTRRTKSRWLPSWTARSTFGRISEIIERVLDAHTPAPATSVEAVRDADRWARARARELVRIPC